MPRNPRFPAERCTMCGVGLRHELLTFWAHLIDSDWVLCPPCAAVMLERFRRSHAEAEQILDTLWNLPAKEPGAW